VSLKTDAVYPRRSTESRRKVRKSEILFLGGSHAADYNPITMRRGVSIGNHHVRQLRRALLSWYEKNGRDLPWRRTQDPYRIWVSEVMLQQTRVAVVIERYQRFLQRFSSVRELARAKESSVLAEWSGLGYYLRARNLHAAARVIVRQLKGEFPRSSQDLRTLPGIGKYTAAAVASIAFGEAVAVVDGNVERVLSRLLGRGIAGEQFWSAAQTLLDERRPGDFNQAMMELGATVCLPEQPRCAVCPLQRFCRTRGRGQTLKNKLRQFKREVAYALSLRADSVLLVRRPVDHKLMAGMWELPEAILRNDSDELLFWVKHSITVTNFKVKVVKSRIPPGTGRWISVSRLNTIPLTGLARKILSRAEII
jgi:A/G-specific adenine glycosylase